MKFSTVDEVKHLEQDKSIEDKGEMSRVCSTVLQYGLVIRITIRDVKNHFFSQLRMALRHLNKVIGKPGSYKMKPIKAGIIYKVISTCDQKYKKDSKTDR